MVAGRQLPEGDAPQAAAQACEESDAPVAPEKSASDLDGAAARPYGQRQCEISIV